MPEDWKNLVIETGVDSLLRYLADHKEASIQIISPEIGVRKSRIQNWAEMLEEEGLLKREETQTGTVLRYDEDCFEQTKMKVQVIGEDLKTGTDEMTEQQIRKNRKASKKLEKVLEVYEGKEIESRELGLSSIRENLGSKLDFI